MNKTNFAARPIPLLSLLWIIFLIFTTVGFVVMPLGIGAVEVQQWVKNSGLQQTLILLLKHADSFWMLLAAVNVYFYMIEREGLVTARRWALLLIIASGVLEWTGTVTGFPFGPYIYTDNFGGRIGGVLPYAIPLAWLVVVMCSRYALLAFFPKLNPWFLSLGVALMALITDVNMEPVAWKVRAYWLWYPHDPAPPHWPPWQNYASWFVAAFLLNLALRGERVAGERVSALRPITVLALINTLFIAVHLVQWWRS